MLIKCEKFGPDESGETPFVRGLSYCFEKLAVQIVKRPWTFVFISSFITLITVIRIPFTPMTNDVSDFTPAEARARKEVETMYQ
uniref:Uncharacterized protein n=1 Tax=Panagrolaimus davidi TaxID=227884 RepID=A0A914PUT3_9BILA